MKERKTKRRKDKKMNEDTEIIELNGQKYVACDDTQILPAVETDHIIVIAQRGWIFEGHRDRSVTDQIVLLSANVVRKWDNGRGIGGLVKVDHKSEYTLDPVGTMRFAPEAVIAIIDVTEW